MTSSRQIEYTRSLSGRNVNVRSSCSTYWLVFGNGEAEAIPLRGPGTDVPEFSNALQREVQSGASPVEFIDGGSDELLPWII
jgi:hypothetical protein